MPDRELLETVRREREQAIERDLERQKLRHALSVEVEASGTKFTAACACGLWALENFKVSHPVDREAARLLVEEEHENHRKSVVGHVEWGYSTGRCLSFVATDGNGMQTVGHISVSGGRRNRCQVCRQNWSIAQCDYPTGGKCSKCKGKGVRADSLCHDCTGTGRRMCNKRLCVYCVAHKEPQEDYCPEHRVAAGFPPALRRERCHWIDNGAHHGGRCLHRGCGVLVEPGQRALYFPDRQRLMCGSCGESYMKATVAER